VSRKNVGADLQVRPRNVQYTVRAQLKQRPYGNALRNNVGADLKVRPRALPVEHQAVVVLVVFADVVVIIGADPDRYLVGAVGAVGPL